MENFKFIYKGKAPLSVELDGEWIVFQPNEEREFDSEYKDALLSLQGIEEIKEKNKEKK